MRISHWSIALSVMLLAAACGAPANRAPEAQVPTTEPAAPTAAVPATAMATTAPTAAAAPTASGDTAAPPTEEVPPDALGVAEQLAEQARADLAQRLSLTVDDVKLVGLGREQVALERLRCDRPSGNQATAEALSNKVVALAITLEANGEQYTYYSRGRQVHLCP